MRMMMMTAKTRHDLDPDLNSFRFCEGSCVASKIDDRGLRSSGFLSPAGFAGCAMLGFR